MPLNNHEVSLASNPIDLRIKRSRVSMHKKVATTLDSGRLVPIFWRAVLPGSTIQMSINSFVRMTTPIHPVMDSAFVDIVAFSIPLRLVYDHWEELRGENSNTYWEVPTEYTIPQITSPASTGWIVGGLADQLGFPPEVPGYSVSSLPFKAYALVWNDWWRAESISQPVSIDTGDSNISGKNNVDADYVTEGYLGGALLPVARFHDVFSSALMQPQAGEAAIIPVADVTDTYAPVYAYNLGTGSFVPDFTTKRDDNFRALKWGQVSLDNSVTPNTWKLEPYPSGNKNVIMHGVGETDASTLVNTPTVDAAIAPINLYANLSDMSGTIGVTINDLRNAFAIQHVLEVLNRGGTRYKEILESAFGVTSPDARLQRPELLGMRRIPVMMQEVNQTSSTDSTSPLGTPGANSKTFDYDSVLFQHSFVEDCLVMITACVRPSRTYAQGVPPWSRKRSRFDFYYPQMQGLGDKPIPNSMIYIQSDSVTDSDGNVVNDLPFGYQQAWFEEFTDYNEVRGLFRPQVNQTLASWNYSDYYTQLPTLSHEWMYDAGNISRTISIQNQPEFNAQFEFNSIWTLPIQVGRAPGLDVL